MQRLVPDFLVSYEDGEILEELKRLASSLGKVTLSKREVDDRGRVSATTVIKRFGSLRKALQAAGLRPTRYMKATDEEVLGILVELWTRTLEAEGRRPFRRDLKAQGFPLSSDTVVRRYGSWRAALVQAAESVTNEGAPETAATAEAVDPAPTAERRGISVRKRFFVFKRDNYRCRMCGASGIQIEVDHVVPVKQGGSDALDNL